MKQWKPPQQSESIVQKLPGVTPAHREEVQALYADDAILSSSQSKLATADVCVHVAKRPRAKPGSLPRTQEGLQTHPHCMLLTSPLYKKRSLTQNLANQNVNGRRHHVIVHTINDTTKLTAN